MTGVDFSQLDLALLELMQAAVVAAIPILIGVMLKWLGLQKNNSLVDNLTTAAEAAAGVAYQYAAGKAGGLSDVQIKNEALALGLKYVLDKLPQTLAQLGLTPDHVKSMVEARLGVLLAGDPTVNATLGTGPVPAPAPVKGI